MAISFQASSFRGVLGQRGGLLCYSPQETLFKVRGRRATLRCHGGDVALVAGRLRLGQN